MKTPVLLRAVNKSRHSPKHAAPAPSAAHSKGTTCAQQVNNKNTRYCSPVIPDIFTDLDPLIALEVHRILDSAEGAEAAFLDAWERVGRQDAKRGARPMWSRAEAQTMTPRGLACLKRYAVGYADELEAAAAEARQAVER